MRKDIKVSFKDNPDEDRLYDDIMAACKFIGQAPWMKIAAIEKLERDHGSCKVRKPNVTNNQGGFINSLDDLFGK